MSSHNKSDVHRMYYSYKTSFFYFLVEAFLLSFSSKIKVAGHELRMCE